MLSWLNESAISPLRDAVVFPKLAILTHHSLNRVRFPFVHQWLHVPALRFLYAPKMHATVIKHKQEHKFAPFLRDDRGAPLCVVPIHRYHCHFNSPFLLGRTSHDVFDPMSPTLKCKRTISVKLFTDTLLYQMGFLKIAKTGI